MVTVTAVKITIVVEHVINDVHKTVRKACVIKTMNTVSKAVLVGTGESSANLHAHDTVKVEVAIAPAVTVEDAFLTIGDQSVSNNVQKTVKGMYVIKVVENVQMGVLIFIMAENVRTPVELPAVPDIVTDITVHVPDVVTDILVRFARTPVVQTVLREHVINRRENVREDVKQTGMETGVTVSSGIALSFDGFGSISWQSIWSFFDSFTLFTLFPGFPTFSARVPLKRLD
jgi:hypothetical protein